MRLKSLLKTIENLTLKEAGERLIAYLWELTEEGKKVEFTPSIPKSQLALLLGITPKNPIPDLPKTKGRRHHSCGRKESKA